jgi:N6-adenosine-specific RNA methylase IME4
MIPFPNKKYSIVYADPPWKQTKGGLRNVRPNQGKTLDYPVLCLNDIKEIINNVPTEKNHVLFLWTIDKYLHDAEFLFPEYRLHARFVWDKENGIAPAFTIRYSHEYLLWLYKDNFLPISKEQQGKYTTVMREKSTIHSRKPIIARKMIDDLYPTGERIELFARQRVGNWDCWGNEV